MFEICLKDLIAPIFKEENGDTDEDDRQDEQEDAGNNEDAGAEANGAPEQADNDNWREWERVADELTWQRLLGLDGSLLFLEHVFWVISLNTLFTVLFGMFFCVIYTALVFLSIMQ